MAWPGDGYDAEEAAAETTRLIATLLADGVTRVVYLPLAYTPGNPPQVFRGLVDESGEVLPAGEAFRLLARQRTFAAVIIGTLALGIGANTAIFSIIDGLLLRPLPVDDPERLVQLAAAPPSEQRSWTHPIWEEIQRHAGRFDGAFAWTRFDAEFDLSTGGESRFVDGVWASAGAFDVLGVEPAFGRLFQPSDDAHGGSGGPVVVISHAFWRQAYGADPGAVGRTLRVNGQPLTIVGVAPSGFTGAMIGAAPEVFVPLGLYERLQPGRDTMRRGTSGMMTWLQMFG